MSERERFTAWVTKYALTEGILKMLVEQSNNFPDMVTKVNGHFRASFHGNEWHRTHEAAIVRAKLKSIDKQRARIAALRFEDEKPRSLLAVETREDGIS